MPDLLTKIANVLTAVAGILTPIATALTAVAGILTFISRKKARQPEQPHAAETPVGDQLAPGNSASLRLVRLDGPPNRLSSRRRLKFAVVVLGIMSVIVVVLSLFTLIYTGSLFQLVPLTFFGVCVILYAIIGKRLWSDRIQNSWVQRQATLRIQGGFDKLWDGCISALNKIGAEVRALDTDKGFIESRTGWSWKSFGETIAIQISAAGPDMFDVHVKSDSILMTTALDYGRNASNIRRFIHELVP